MVLDAWKNSVEGRVKESSEQLTVNQSTQWGAKEAEKKKLRGATRITKGGMREYDEPIPEGGSIVKAPAAWFGLVKGAMKPPAEWLTRQIAEKDEVTKISESLPHHSATKAFRHYLRSVAGQPTTPRPIVAGSVITKGGMRERATRSNTFQAPEDDVDRLDAEQAAWIRDMVPDVPAAYKILGLEHVLGTSLPTNKFEDSPYYKKSPEFWETLRKRASVNRAVKGELDSYMRGIERAHEIKQAALYPHNSPHDGTNLNSSMAGEESAYLREYRATIDRWQKLQDKDPGLMWGVWDDFAHMGGGTIQFAWTLVGHPELQEGEGVAEAGETMGQSMTGGLAGSLEAAFTEDPKYGLKIVRQPAVLAAVVMPPLVGLGKLVSVGRRAKVVAAAEKSGKPVPLTSGQKLRAKALERVKTDDQFGRLLGWGMRIAAKETPLRSQDLW